MRNNIFKQIQSAEKEISDVREDDDLLKALEDYFTVGRGFTFDEILAVTKEGKHRYEFKIPPGYGDLYTKEKKGTQILFGDLIIWKQILEFSKEKQLPIILILNDITKDDDWCYLDINNKMTTDKKGPIHLKDSMGHYLFYKGFRDYVKVSLELGKFDHGYIDSGIRTVDKKIIWKYEFSPVEVASDFNNSLEGYEKLTLEGLNEPMMIKSFKEYYNDYHTTKSEHKTLFSEILKNILFEKEKIKKIHDDLFSKKEYLTNEEESILWIPQKDLLDIKNTINLKIDEVKKLLSSYTILVEELEMAIDGKI